jgi:hypothetical protein
MALKIEFGGSGQSSALVYLQRGEDDILPETIAPAADETEKTIPD